MKLQAIVLVAVVISFFTTTNADAGNFNLGDVIRTAQKINNSVNNHQGGGKITYPSPDPPVHTLPVEPPRHTYPTPVEPPHCKPAPPVCKPQPPVCKKPPVNRPPVRCAKMKLMNNAGAEVYFVLNNANDYITLGVDTVEIVESHNGQPHLISYHNGQQMVEYELDPNATYSFEWEGDTLQLFATQS
ncbi:MAG: hypothetical protein HUJ26_00535 [Planctomycetaceae bacterium]|nr:hypothetical protein [Planctomycetaceae bacterium]